MRPITFRIARGPENKGCDTYHGFVVEGTDDLFVIDQRYAPEPDIGEPAIFAITHLPSGRRLRHGILTRAESIAQAVHIALGFHREIVALGIDPKSFDGMARQYSALTPRQINEFWNRVREGFPA